MTKKNNTLPALEDFDECDFEGFVKALEGMESEDAQFMLQNLVNIVEEAGETVPLSIRLLASKVLFGLTQTPVGLAYGVGGCGQLILTGFISEEDIEEMGDAETILQMIMDEFEENTPIVVTRDDDAIGAMVKSVLDGSYQMDEEIFEGMEATDLQRAVWKELTNIPYGETISYEELATRIGKPKAVRAVASAVGENPLSIVIPCHRIVLKSGKVGEYRWGSDIKEKILSYEKTEKKA